MDSLLIEWIELGVRWLHIIAAIAWIGASFFFMWLDSHLEAPDAPRRGIEGELWMVHSGGFYRVEKMHVAPETLPRTLHWFKWEAAFTWISGVALLAVAYYFGIGVGAMAPDLEPLGAPGVTVLALVLLAAAWAVYDGLYASALGRTAAAPALSFALMVALAWGLSEVMNGRAAFIHVGAVLGTLMTANVWVRIIPAQRELVAAKKEDRAPDAALGQSAKQRSVHNNYMTLPVVFLMMSNHFPSTWSHSLNWLVLAILALVGVGVRHYFNRRHKGENPVWIWPVAGAAMVALFFLVRG